MYSQSRTAVTYWRYAVVYDDGKEKDLPFEAVAFSEPRALVAKLDQRLRACRCAAGDTRLDAALTSILAVAHRGRSEAVAGVRIYQYRLRHPAIGPERMALSYTWEPTK